MRRFARTTGSFAVIFTVLAALATAAFGSDSNQGDAQDVAGKFDVVAVDLIHDADSGRWDTQMARTWTLREAWDAGYVFLYLDTQGAPDADFYVLVRSTGRGLKAALYRDAPTGKDPRLEAVTARRPSPKTVRIEIALSRLAIAEARTEWFWSVQTLWTSDACPQVCSDLVPDSGSVAQATQPFASLEPAATNSPGGTAHPIQATPNPQDGHFSPQALAKANGAP